MMMAPSFLALALIITALYGGTRSRRHEAGLLKALGWTTQDVAGFFMCKSVLVALPASALGVAVSYALVYWPGIAWPGYLFFGWQGNPPELYLDTLGSVRILIQVTGGVLIPYLLITLWPAVENATADPYELLKAEGAL